MATDTSDQEQQQRELEEIRRKFQQVSARLGSAFEPAPPDDEEDEDVRSTRPALPAPKQAKPWTRPPSWLVAASVSLVFLLGTGFGYLLSRANVEDSAARTPARSATSLAPGTPPATRAVAPPACLDTAKKGDALFALLTSKANNQRLVADKLKAYSLASQACSKEASP
jgi:hypothetical protein